jgi:hypothetical protein
MPSCSQKALLELAMLLLATAMSAETPIFASTKRKEIKPTLLSPSVFIKHLKYWIGCIGLDPKEYSEHSLRRGGATALLCAGIDPLWVQLQGRWWSDAYKLYLQWSSNLLAITK